jgi:hypothetical protein
LTGRLSARFVRVLLVVGVVPSVFHSPVDIVGAGNAAAIAVSPSAYSRGCGQPKVKRHLNCKTRGGFDACVEAHQEARTLLEFRFALVKRLSLCPTGRGAAWLAR